MKRFLSALLSGALLTAALAGPTYAAEPDFTFKLTLDPNAFGPRVSILEAAGYESAESKAKFEQPVSGNICEGVGADPCNSNGKFNLFGHMLLPLCSDSVTNCISGLSAVVDGVRVQAEFLKYVGPSDVPADPKHGLLGAGKSASLWRIPGAVNSAGADTYMVLGNYHVDYVGSKYVIRDFAANVVPYVEESAPGQKAYSYQQEMIEGKKRVSFSGGPEKCVWVQADKCGVLADFPITARFSLKLRMQNVVSNWFNGRLEKPDIAITAYSKTSNTITIEAGALQVPVFDAIIKQSDFPSELKKNLAAMSINVKFPGGGGASTDHPGAMKIVDLYREVLKDTTSKTSTVWSIKNLQGQGRRCLESTKEVLGVVTTNSMTFQSQPPQFVNGAIQYDVAGMHYQPNGTSLQIGTYELVVRSSVARCLFGLPNVPLSASVSVVSDKGTKTTATTVVSEKNGWLKLRATGFTFSNKTIKVKITKKKK